MLLHSDLALIHPFVTGELQHGRKILHNHINVSSENGEPD
jgi:hypothetical protein